jgi:hypothetical protein
MSAEKLASGTTGWTVESTLIHLNAALSDQKERFKDSLEAQEKKNQQQFADADKAVKAAMAAAEKAVDKAEQNAEKWRSNANEWRSAMSDRERNFAPVQRLDALEKIQDQLKAELMKEISGLRESRSESGGEKQTLREGLQQRQWHIGIMIAIGTGVLALFVQLMKVVK